MFFLTSPARQRTIPHSRPARSSIGLLLGLPARPQPRNFINPLRPSPYNLYSLLDSLARLPCHGAPPVPVKPVKFVSVIIQFIFNFILHIHYHTLTKKNYKVYNWINEFATADRTSIISFTVDGLMVVLSCDIIFLAELNDLSTAAEEAGIQKTFLANFDKFGNICSCSFQKIKGLSLSFFEYAEFDNLNCR